MNFSYSFMGPKTIFLFFKAAQSSESLLKAVKIFPGLRERWTLGTTRLFLKAGCNSSIDPDLPRSLNSGMYLKL